MKLVVHLTWQSAIALQCDYMMEQLKDCAVKEFAFIEITTDSVSFGHSDKQMANYFSGFKFDQSDIAVVTYSL